MTSINVVALGIVALGRGETIAVGDVFGCGELGT